MRFRTLLPVGAACAVLPMLYFLFPHYEDHDNIGEFAEWKPTPAQITQSLGKGTGQFSDTRHKEFAKIFQQRFRDHEIAVGVHFLNAKTIKLMCGAIVPRWDMARVAAQLHKESYELFGVDYQVDIYETYISRRMKKLGELRQTGRAGHTTVDFDPKYETALELLEPERQSRPVLLMRAPLPFANPRAMIPQLRKRMMPAPPPQGARIPN